MHTTVSDGTDTPEEILARVKEAGIELFAVTDHDGIKGCEAIRSILTENDPQYLTGVELSCRDEKGKYHILGYGFDPDSEAIRQVVETTHSYRMSKVLARLEFLESEFHMTFPEEEVRKLLSMDNPGKPHIGNLMVQYGYAESKEQAITRYINKVHFRNRFIRPEEAIKGILNSGGIPVLAHPAYGDGDQLILGDEMDRRLKHLTAYGIQGMECFYSGFSPKIRSEMLSFAETYGLYITAGSDYHGNNKLVILGDTGLPEAKEFPDGLKRFLETMENKMARPFSAG